jgi:hypothetical protein
MANPQTLDVTPVFQLEEKYPQLRTASSLSQSQLEEIYPKVQSSDTYTGSTEGPKEEWSLP